MRMEEIEGREKEKTSFIVHPPVSQVTALKFADPLDLKSSTTKVNEPGCQLLLAANAGWLQLYGVSSKETILLSTSPRIFKEGTGRIHKITQINDIQPAVSAVEAGSTSEDDPISVFGREMTFLVSGGKCLAVVALVKSPETSPSSFGIWNFTAKCTVYLKDWIQDVVWLREDDYAYSAFDKDQLQVAILFSHNFIERWQLSLGPNFSERSEGVKSSSLQESVQCETRCNLYSGKLFFNPEKDATVGPTRMLKRSWDNLLIASGTIFNEVLLWKSSLINDMGSAKKEAKVIARCVGHEGVLYGIDHHENVICTVSDDRTIRVWDVSSCFSKTSFKDGIIECKEISILKGHLGRVWGSRFCMESFIISISEDASCRVWNWKTKECLACWEGHGSKHVWSLASSSEGKLVCTGGGDGGIRMWDLEEVICGAPKEKEILRSSLPMGEGEKAAKYVAMLDIDSILILGGKGILTNYTVSSKISRKLHEDADLIPFAQMKLNQASTAILLSDKWGNLTLISPFGKFESFKWKACSSKIVTIFFSSTKNDEQFNIFTVCGNLMNFIEWHEVILDSGKVIPRQSLKIKLAPKVIAREIHYNNDGILGVGDRMGTLILYDLSKGMPAADLRQEDISAIIIYRNLHQDLSLDTIFIEKNGRDGNIWTVMTGGRDGYFKRFMLSLHIQKVESQSYLEFQDPYWDLSPVTSFKAGRGGIERIYHRNGSSILLMVFFNEELIIYDEARKLKLASVSCGGRDRIWDLWCKNGNSLNISEFTCAYICDGVPLYISNQATNVFNPIVKESYHSNDTQAISYIPSTIMGKQHRLLLISAGEDEILTLNTVNSTNYTLNPVLLDFFQTSGSTIRCLSLLLCDNEDSMELSYLFSAGSKQTLIAWKVLVNSRGSVLVSEIASADRFNEAIEARVMDVTSMKFNSQILVATASSDCYLRLWLFDPSLSSFKLLSQDDSHKRCIQKVELFVINSTLLLMSAATDGILRLWDVKEGNMTLLQMWKIHQSGVKAISLLIDEEKNLVTVLTGGDDNSIGLLTISLANSLVSASKWQVMENAHGSSITGCYIASANSFYSVSIDQRLNQYTMIEGKINLQSAAFLDVADVGDLACIKDERGNLIFALAGHGMQIIEAI